MTNKAEYFCHEEDIYFYCLNLGLIYSHHQYLFNIYNIAILF